MKKQSDNTHVFSRRAFFIAGLQLAGLCILAGRLAWLQVVHGIRYKTLSDKNRINIRMLAPVRGQIVDRFGVPLAVNVQSYHVLIVPEQVKNLQQALYKLQQIIAISDEAIKKVMKQALKTASFTPIKVKENLTWEEVARIEVNLPDLPGLFIDKGGMRSYPYGLSTAHIIGYVGAVSQKDLDTDPLLGIPGFKIGKSGLEKTWDTSLRGRPGASEIEVNVVGREVRELNRKEAQAGDRITLAIDGELQRFTQEILDTHRSASAVVMDAHTGAVYAMASSPSFDPNIFTRGISAEMWQSLLADPGSPLTNKAIAGQYPPGSTFKMVTALAALEAGKADETTRVYCPGFYDLGNNRFHCWKKEGHGSVGLVDALAQSCDTFFYAVSESMGIEAIASMARRFGFGSRLGFDIEEERPGQIPDKAWKINKFGERWHQGETIITAIGQGYTLATPLQLAVMTARLVNGGYAVKPWITGYVGNDKKGRPAWPSLNLKKEHLTLVGEGMRKAVNEQGGTAYSSRIINLGMEMAGKTGTAQVQRITKEQRALGIKNEDLPWLQRHHALFVGYAPVHNPKYICSIVVEHGVGGSSTAAPAAKEILFRTQIRNPADVQLKPATERNSHSAIGAPNRELGQN